MDHIYKINTDLDIPIYQQLVDAIQVAIKKEILISGQQLPTVQYLTEKLGVAKGTVKRAYDELEHLGYVEKVQGRGTFVSYHPDHAGSRKERAMSAIGKLLSHLEEMGLTPNEINIFVNLKLRERFEKEASIKVAVVECTPENLSQIASQLRYINGVELHSYLLKNIKQYPYKLGENFDLLITTSTHADYLESVVPVKSRVIRTALRPSAKGLSGIIKIGAGKRVGIVAYSKRFGKILHQTCQQYVENANVFEAISCEEQSDISAYLKDKDVILLPDFYEKRFTPSQTEAVARFGGEKITCYYEMDEGSVLYLKNKIKRLLEQKRIEPTA